ncbi:MAG: hypothetical protein MJZ68_01520 [archaeon]|nr:hypothetical protein [archaeon]
MRDFEYYDSRNEARRLRSLQYKMEQAETLHFAKQGAMKEHPVMQYVRGLDVEDTSYPAMSELDFAKQKATTKEGSEGQEGVQEAMHRWTYNQYIHWMMPGRDQERPRTMGCGFVKTDGGELVYTACPTDTEHHCKAKRFHCWSLRCSECMPDTTLKKGIEVEKQLLKYRTLSVKSGSNPGDIGHWVVSPPQELCKSLVQTKPEFDELFGHIDDALVAFGAKAGVTIFHPWRQTADKWAFSPHFHSLCYGRIDTKGFLKEHPGWIIKKVHPREKVRSIRHTAAYLLSHGGLGLAEVDPDSIDWDLRFLDLMWPDDGPCDRDLDDSVLCRIREKGDFTGFDWEKWTFKPLSIATKYRFWGEASRRKIRTVANYRQYKVRVCEECGAMLKVYNGTGDIKGELVRYIQDNPVVVFANNYGLWQSTFQRYKDRLREADMNVAEFAEMLPFAACSLEFGLPTNQDIVCDGPFDDEERILARQRKAYGENNTKPQAEA